MYDSLGQVNIKQQPEALMFTKITLNTDAPVTEEQSPLYIPSPQPPYSITESWFLFLRAVKKFEGRIQAAYKASRFAPLHLILQR